MLVSIQIALIGLALVLFVLSLKWHPLKISNQMIAICSLLISLAVILGSYLKIAIPLFGTETFEIKFDVIPIMLIGFIYGPSLGLLSGLMVDSLQMLLVPISFPFFGFTFNLMLIGFLSGMIVRAKNLKPIRLVAMVTIVLAVLAGCYYALVHLSQWWWALIITACGVIILKQLQHDPIIISIILCELIVELLLTSIWLMVLFKLDIGLLLMIRLVKCSLMVGLKSILVAMSFQLLPSAVKKYSCNITKFNERG